MRRILLVYVCVCVYEELLLFQPKIETNTFCWLLVYGERYTLGQKCYKNPLMIHNNISLPPIKSVDIFFYKLKPKVLHIFACYKVTWISYCNKIPVVYSKMIFFLQQAYKSIIRLIYYKSVWNKSEENS